LLAWRRYLQAEAQAEADVVRREKQLAEVNTALDALKTASDIARVAQMAANGMGLAEVGRWRC
jgi:hypothetical protein